MLKVGLGTGIGYLVCNFPPLFTATPRVIAVAACGSSLLVLLVANRRSLHFVQDGKAASPQQKPFAFLLVLAWLTALVWLDSAAFYIIQNSPRLKSGTWQGDLLQWRAGVLHLAAALVSGWLLTRHRLSVTLGMALLSLGGACLLLAEPADVSLAAVLYPIGVSLYSVALVAYPSLLMPAASPAQRARIAGYLYALAGWIGSALGIGMGRNLHYVPLAFVAGAVALFVLPWLWHAVAGSGFEKSFQIHVLVLVFVPGLAFAIASVIHPILQLSAASAALSPVERGRQVYIAEGCINCHSQYVRPNSDDVVMWGPVTDLETIRHQQPPLIGNRRQGPDLSQVGARRSPLWLRIHFIDPRDVSDRSIMPRFDYLFRDSRGDDLLVYLGSLNNPAHWQNVARWRPSPGAQQASGQIDGSRLFAEHCAACHSPTGAVRDKWASSFRRLPPDLARDPLQHIAQQAAEEELRVDVARVTKFGLQGTDMPGHEYLPDEQVVAIADFVLRLRKGLSR